MGNRWQLRVTRPEGQAGAQLGEGSYPHSHRIKPPPAPGPHPPLPPPDLQREGWDDNQRNTL